jgi:hypothetical protein
LLKRNPSFSKYLENKGMSMKFKIKFTSLSGIADNSKKRYDPLLCRGSLGVARPEPGQDRKVAALRE